VARAIEITFDYRCPFARNANEAVVNAIRDGALPDVTWRFRPFSLDQSHAEEGEAPVWEREPDAWGGGTLSLLYGIAVRDVFPESFLDAHLALFAVRHDHGLHLEDEAVLREAVAAVGLDADAVATEAWSGRPLKTLATEHVEAVERWHAFGVPTFLTEHDGDAAFVRLMERGHVDDLARSIELLEWHRFNEFKRPRIPR